MPRDYRTTPMHGITEAEYETLTHHLGEQLAALLAPNVPDGEAPKAAADALANTWQDRHTATEWLAAAGRRLGVDTSGCAGA